jgi:hypothetical protein
MARSTVINPCGKKKTRKKSVKKKPVRKAVKRKTVKRKTVKRKTVKKNPAIKFTVKEKSFIDNLAKKISMSVDNKDVIGFQLNRKDMMILKTMLNKIRLKF